MNVELALVQVELRHLESLFRKVDAGHARAARGQDAGGVLQRRVRGGVRVLEVEDPGPGFEPPESPRERPSGGGRGLVLVERMTSRWGVSRDGASRVWFEVDRPSTRAA